MRNFVQRLLRIGRARTFDAAGGGRRWESAETVDGLNAAILAGATTAARRAGWYARNNPWVAAAVDSLVGNVVGAGIKPQSTHHDCSVRERLQALWLRWTDAADAGGLGDFYGLQAMAVRAMVESGESFAHLKTAPDQKPGIVPLTIELLDREQVSSDLHREIGGGARIRAGIEFDSAGRRVACWVRSSRPGDPFGPLRMDPVRVPAADCIHLFKPLVAGQLRGIIWLAPVLLRLHELDQFEDAALVKAKVAALFTGFITDPDGTVSGLSGTSSNGVLQVGMEPGSLIPLPPGADIRFSNPTEHDAYAPFVKNHLRAIAAGMGLPYELVSGDLEGVTYSSIRAGLIEFRRRVEQLQHNVVVHLFCRPVWERFVRLAVPTPADPGAHIRMETDMTDTASPAADAPPITTPDPESVQTRAARNAEIRSIARIAGLDQVWVDGQIDAGADADTARRAAFEALAKRSAPTIHTEQVRVEMGESQDDPALRARQMGEALYARINPRHPLSEPARRYAYATPVDMAKELLALRGESTMALSPASLVTRALHTTSDFPIILGDTVGRVLRDAYQAAPAGVRRLGRQTTARDFRAVNKIMLGEAPLLERLNEHGEIKAGTMAEARGAYRVETWARKIGITRQVLVNDDLGAFSDLARRLGSGAAETEARILVDLLEANSGNGPKLSDNKTLFHVDHGNKAGSGAAISDGTLSAARLALRTQKGVEDRTIRVTPKHLLVPPALETTAEKWLATIAPATAADVNPFSGSLSLVVEPRLSSATRWYVTADPGEIDGLEFAYLSGNEGPQVESRSGWDVDGVEIRVILDFGAGFIDHRGWFMNPGA